MFKTARLSTVRFINSNVPQAAEYIDWDATSDLAKIPDSDLIGLHGFSMVTETKLHTVTFGVTIAVLDDPNLFRLTDYVNTFYNIMQAEKTFNIIDPSSNAVIAQAVFADGLMVHPLNRFESRASHSLQTSCQITLSR